MENVLPWLIAIAALFLVISIFQLFAQVHHRIWLSGRMVCLGVTMTGEPKLIGRSVYGGNWCQL